MLGSNSELNSLNPEIFTTLDARNSQSKPPVLNQYEMNQFLYVNQMKMMQCLIDQ